MILILLGPSYHFHISRNTVNKAVSEEYVLVYVTVVLFTGLIPV